MKYLKLFERTSYSRGLYYKDSYNDLLDKNWTDLKINKDHISFILENNNEYKYIIYYEKNGSINDILLEDPKSFTDKFILEFKKHPYNYIDDIEKDLLFLGDLNKYRKSKEFNL